MSEKIKTPFDEIEKSQAFGNLPEHLDEGQEGVTKQDVADSYFFKSLAPHIDKDKRESSYNKFMNDRSFGSIGDPVQKGLGFLGEAIESGQRFQEDVGNSLLRFFGIDPEDPAALRGKEIAKHAIPGKAREVQETIEDLKRIGEGADPPTGRHSVPEEEFIDKFFPTNALKIAGENLPMFAYFIGSSAIPGGIVNIVDVEAGGVADAAREWEVENNLELGTFDKVVSPAMVGIGNAAIELLQLGIVKKMVQAPAVRGLWNKIITKVARTVTDIGGQTNKKLTFDILKNWAGGTGAEVLTEMVQEMVALAGESTVESEIGVDTIEKLLNKIGENLDRVAEAGAGAAILTAPLGGIGAGRTVSKAVAARRAASQKIKDLQTKHNPDLDNVDKADEDVKDVADPPLTKDNPFDEDVEVASIRRGAEAKAKITIDEISHVVSLTGQKGERKAIYTAMGKTASDFKDISTDDLRQVFKEFVGGKKETKLEPATEKQKDIALAGVVIKPIDKFNAITGTQAITRSDKIAKHKELVALGKELGLDVTQMTTKQLEIEIPNKIEDGPTVEDAIDDVVEETVVKETTKESVAEAEIVIEESDTKALTRLKASKKKDAFTIQNDKEDLRALANKLGVKLTVRDSRPTMIKKIEAAKVVGEVIVDTVSKKKTQKAKVQRDKSLAEKKVRQDKKAKEIEGTVKPEPEPTKADLDQIDKSFLDLPTDPNEDAAFDLDGNEIDYQNITPKDEMDINYKYSRSHRDSPLRVDNIDDYNSILTGLKELFPWVEVAIVDELYNEFGMKVMGAAFADMAVVSLDPEATIDNPPHEFFHIYSRLMAKDPYVMAGEKAFGGNENLTKFVGQYYARVEMSQSLTERIGLWLKDFWLLLKSKFSVSNLTEEEIGRVLTRRFRDGIQRPLTVEEQQHLKDMKILGYRKLQESTIDYQLFSDKSVAPEYQEYMFRDSRRAQGKDWARVIVLRPETNLMFFNRRMDTAIAEAIKNDDNVSAERYKGYRRLGRIGKTLTSDYIEAELSRVYKTHNEVAAMHDMLATLTTKNKFNRITEDKRPLLKQATKDIVSGKEVTDPELNKAARWTADLFKRYQQEMIKTKVQLFRLTRGKNQYKKVMDAVNDRINGIPLQHVLDKYEFSNRDLARFEDAMKDLKQIYDWGLDEYVTNIEKGSFKIIKVTQGKAKGPIAKLTDKFETQAIAETRGEAFRRAKEVEENLKAAGEKDFRIEIDNSWVKKPDPTKQRQGVLEGGENFEEILSTYIFAMRKQLDMMIPTGLIEVYRRQTKPVPLVHKILGNLLDSSSMQESFSDFMFDTLVEQMQVPINKAIMAVYGDATKQIGGSPLRFTKSVTGSRNFAAKVIMGWRLAAPLVNYIGGQGRTIWTMGARNFAEAQRQLKDENSEVFRFVNENEDQLGIKLALDVQQNILKANKGIVDTKWWHALGFMSMVEGPIRKHALGTAYLYAKQNPGNLGSQSAIERQAREMLRFTQLVYITSALPPILASTNGRLLFQFKGYFLSEMEMLGWMDRSKFMSFLSYAMLVAGPRGAIRVLRSSPLISSILGWQFIPWGDSDDEDRLIDSDISVEEWLDIMSTRVTEALPGARDLDVDITAGIPGLVGLSLEGPAVPQLPEQTEHFFGPVISIAARVAEHGIVPLYQELTGEDVQRGLIGAAKNFTTTDYKNSMKRLGDASREIAIDTAPLGYYWDQLIQTFVNKDGWILDGKGKPRYQLEGSAWNPRNIITRLGLFSGVAPVIVAKESRVHQRQRETGKTHAEAKREASNSIVRDLRSRFTTGSKVQGNMDFTDNQKRLIRDYLITDLSASYKFLGVPRTAQNIIDSNLNTLTKNRIHADALFKRQRVIK